MGGITVGNGKGTRLVERTYEAIVTEIGDMPEEIKAFLGGKVAKEGLRGFRNEARGVDYVGRCYGIQLDPDLPPKRGGATATFFWGAGVEDAPETDDGDRPTGDYLLLVAIKASEAKMKEFDPVLKTKFGMHPA